MASHTMRVPEELHAGAMRVSGLLGTSPGTLLQTAFDEYVENHRSEILEIFEYTKKYVEHQDVEGLKYLVGESRRQRARDAAAAARRGLNDESPKTD